MSPTAPIEVLITRPPSSEAVPPYPLDLQYTAEANRSGSESASPPPDSPQSDSCAPASFGLKSHGQLYQSGGPPFNYSSSPTDSEFFSTGYGDASRPHVHTVPVIPTLLPMSALTSEASASASPSEGEGTKQPEDDYRVSPSKQRAGPSRTRAKATTSAGPASPLDSSAPFDPAHPYARLYTRKEGAKRRKMWNHALEKSLFTPQEISTMGAPQRRTIYTASLEAHIDRLHAQLLTHALFPVPFEKLDCFRGLNTKTAKSMVAGLHRDAAELRVKRLELERAMHSLRSQLYAQPAVPQAYPHAQMHHTAIAMRRHSLD